MVVVCGSNEEDEHAEARSDGRECADEVVMPREAGHLALGADHGGTTGATYTSPV